MEQKWDQAAFEAALLQKPQTVTVDGQEYTVYGQRGYTKQRRYVATRPDDHRVHVLQLPPWKVGVVEAAQFNHYVSQHPVSAADIVRRVARDNSKVVLSQRAVEAVRAHLGVGLAVPATLTAELTAMLEQLERTDAIVSMIGMLATTKDDERGSPRLRTACIQAVRKLAEEQKAEWSRRVL